MKQHELSKAFPSMTESEYTALLENIREHGQRHPIITYHGMVLDGHHRLRACIQLEQEPIFAPYTGIDPAGYVLSSNLHRRHLSASQRAGAIVACNEWRNEGRVQLGTGAELPQTSAQMAETAQVSTRTVVNAKAAQFAGLGELVRDGEIDAKPAAELARKAPEVAARVVAKEITPAQGKAEMQAKVKREPRTFAPPESIQIAQLTAEKEELEAALAAKNAEILELELAGVDECARNEARDKIQGYVDAMNDAIRQEQAALALLDEANYKNGELLRANNAQNSQIQTLKRKLAEFEK